MPKQNANTGVASEIEITPHRFLLEKHSDVHLVDGDTVLGAGVGQEDVLEKGELLGEELDALLQQFVLLKHKKSKWKVEK